MGRDTQREALHSWIYLKPLPPVEQEPSINDNCWSLSPVPTIKLQFSRNLIRNSIYGKSPRTTLGAPGFKSIRSQFHQRRLWSHLTGFSCQKREEEENVLATFWDEIWQSPAGCLWLILRQLTSCCHIRSLYSHLEISYFHLSFAEPIPLLGYALLSSECLSLS